MEYDLIPTGNRCLLKPIEGPGMTRGGIALPDNVYLNKVKRAKVMAVGPGKIVAGVGVVKPDMEAGDTVIYDPHYPLELNDGEHRLILLSCDEVHAVVKVKIPAPV